MKLHIEIDCDKLSNCVTDFERLEEISRSLLDWQQAMVRRALLSDHKKLTGRTVILFQQDEKRLPIGRAEFTKE